MMERKNIYFVVYSFPPPPHPTLYLLQKQLLFLCDRVIYSDELQ